MKTYYTIYKITNNINGKIYIGQHKTTNLDDGYMGSGIAIKEAQENFGIENFTKEILHLCENEDEMNAIEELLVDSDFVNDTNNYNLIEGGGYGWNKVNKNRTSEQAAKNGYKGYLQAKAAGYYESDKWKETQRKATMRYVELYPNGNSTTFNNNKDLQKKANKASQSIEAKNKRKNTLKEIKHSQGEKNSQFGTCWIYNLDLKESKKINKDDLENWISEGWVKGRKIIF